MNIIEYLSSQIGLAFFHFIQALLFSLMVYILSAEYFRTSRDDLIYKLVACSSITIINVITTILLSAEFFYNIVFQEKFLPLIFNTIFAIIVLALARAFVYDFVNNKKKFNRNIHLCMGSVVLFYIILQAYWSNIYENGMIFAFSNLQLIFGIFFLLVLFISIYYTSKFRKSYRLRLLFAFFSIVIVQIINIYISIADFSTPVLKIVKASIPIIVPLMFGSVVFKELIESVVTMVDHLKRVLDLQGDVVKDLMEIGSELSNLSDELVRTSIDGWQKLSHVVEMIYKQEEVTNNIYNLAENSINGINELNENINKRNFESIEIKEFKTGIDKVDNEQKNVFDAIERINNLNENSDKIIAKTGAIISGLNQSISDISDSLKEIEEISDKTSMLSLNASIEAARAGDSGRGFAVVAEGVSKLAEQSQLNSDNVTGQLSGIIAGIDEFNNSNIKIINNLNVSMTEIKKVQKYYYDSIQLSKVYEWIVSTNYKLNREHKESCREVLNGMKKSEFLLEENRGHGKEMKDSISRHIREIEAIAGMSDSLNEMINSLNIKTDHVINMSVEIHEITK